ncbi:MBL fold metallo-hydrolase [Rivularia sp. UHCC 0363]|uniref:MBL fold metallo-hydrolase n=1 Tax=Rivularia sp. UHCC 0363 TaxID=3110244 RepID=UPI002B1FD8D6|nr:MBL fold metallo-hydrolase [Rivularia sp. UHCC 0363]MEA5593048.1 MBL fold metallo-hydrolase [Rivularia sp. UHCC 0363]
MSEGYSIASLDEGGSQSELECFTYGVHQDDEGMCLLVRMGPHRIMLDCGLADISPLTKGLKKSARPENTPLPADIVLITHAHPDHARGLLALHQAFPLIPIYASVVTCKLLPLNWLDRKPEETSSFFQALELRTVIELKENLTVEFFPCGHLPGAVAILLTYTTTQRSYKLLYTGDFFLSNSRLVEGFRLEELRGIELDVLIVEGSYGTARHPHRRNQENQLAERINRAIAEGSSVLMPTPLLGLGQELLMLLRSHHHFTGRDIDIWVDGNIAAGCDAYLELLPHLPASVQNFARHQPLFWDERVRPRVRRLEDSTISNLNNSPCIILTDSKTDLTKYYRSLSRSWLILQPEKTDIRAEHHPELGTVESYLLAQHSDGPGTTQLIHNLRPQHVVFVHGSPAYLADLTGLEELQNRYHVHSPETQTLVQLPIGDTFLQPAAPDTNYAGELTQLEKAILITLTDSITKDPRWQEFADTGLIEVRWQGEELVLRGLSQRELLNQNSDRNIWSSLNCCGTCKHQRGQRCWNPASPLYNFKVTLVGYCPAFESEE